MENNKSNIFPKLKKASSQLNFLSTSPLQFSSYYDQEFSNEQIRFENPEVSIFNNNHDLINSETKRMSRGVSSENISMYDRNSFFIGRSKHTMTNNKFSFCKTKNNSRKLIPSKKHLQTNNIYSSDSYPVFLRNTTIQEIDLKSTIIGKADSFKERIKNQNEMNILDSKKKGLIQPKESKVNDKLVLEKINNLLYPPVKSNSKPYHKNWFTKYIEECRHQSLNHMMIQNPLNQINKNITFPIIVSNRDLIHSLWSDNLKIIENNKKNFPIDKLNIKS